MGLTFNQLRQANITRLPQFKNSKGEPAHSEPDGSDWGLAQWSNAVLGELGETAEALSDFVLMTLTLKHLGNGANIIKKIERGDVTLGEKRLALANELADVQTYLDILAFRSGIDLGEATISKWNEVSERVHCDLRIGNITPLKLAEFLAILEANPAHIADEIGWQTSEISNIVEYLKRLVG